MAVGRLGNHPTAAAAPGWPATFEIMGAAGQTDFGDWTGSAPAPFWDCPMHAHLAGLLLTRPFTDGVRVLTDPLPAAGMVTFDYWTKTP